MQTTCSRLPMRALFLAALVMTSVSVALAADPPPTEIAPSYRPQPIPIETVDNIGDLRTIVTTVLGDEKIDSSAYYIVHRMDYALDAKAFHDIGWYVYYKSWDQKVGALSWLDDPLIHGNYKRTRIYGSNNLHLLPVLVMPSLDFTKADAAVRRQFEMQAATQIANGSSQLTTAVANPAVLQALIEAWRKAPLGADQAADPVSALPALHLATVQPSSLASLDISRGDQLAVATPDQLNATKLSQDQFRILKVLSAWLVRDAPELHHRPAKCRELPGRHCLDLREKGLGNYRDPWRRRRPLRPNPIPGSRTNGAKGSSSL